MLEEDEHPQLSIHVPVASPFCSYDPLRHLGVTEGPILAPWPCSEVWRFWWQAAVWRHAFRSSRTGWLKVLRRGSQHLWPANFGVVWNLAHPIFQWIKTSCSHLIGYLSGSPPLSDKPMSKGYVFPSNVLFQTDDATFISQRQYLMLTRRMTRMTTMLMMSWHMKAQHEKNQYQSTCSWRGVALLSAWKFRATQIWDDSN
jgi:hypothetical protein